jgi:hypothetical protein
MEQAQTVTPIVQPAEGKKKKNKQNKQGGQEAKAPQQTQAIEDEDMELNPFAFEEPPQNPELTEWFKKYPEDKDALALSFQEKKDFILKYYSEDGNSDEMLEKIMDEAQGALDKELNDRKTKAADGFAETLVLAIIALSRGRVIDELLEILKKYTNERRTLVKSKDVNDPGVLKITQINCMKIQREMNIKIIEQVKEEAKSNGLEEMKIATLAYYFMSNDIQNFAEIERVFNFRTVEASREIPIDIEQVKKYTRETLRITDMIINGQIDSAIVYVFPQLLSDRLFNITGFESEQVVYFVRQSVIKGTIDAELADLIIREAYAVEKSKNSCQESLNMQIDEYQRRMRELYIQQEIARNQDPLNDKSVQTMIQMGLLKQSGDELLKRRAEERLKLAQQEQILAGGLYTPNLIGAPQTAAGTEQPQA